MDSYELIAVQEEGHSPAGTALSAYEKNMFDARLVKAERNVANDVAHDSLRYLFGIFN